MPSDQFNNLVQMFKSQRGLPEPEIGQLRESFEMLGQIMAPADGVEITETEFAGMPGARFVPDGAPTDRALLYLHGGGYCIGSRTSHRGLVSRLAKAANVLAFVPEYRLAPEAPYPAAVEDAIAAYDWVLDQGFDPAQIAIAGDSAGGGLSGALLIALRDAGKALPASATLISPWCDLVELGDISSEADEIDFLRPETIAMFTRYYTPDASQRTDATCSPARADLSGLPPMLVQVGGSEILCDQGSRMAARAKDSGVDVTLDLEPEMFHAWPLFAGALPEADEAIARIGAFVNAHSA